MKSYPVQALSRVIIYLFIELHESIRWSAQMPTNAECRQT